MISLILLRLLDLSPKSTISHRQNFILVGTFSGTKDSFEFMENSKAKLVQLDSFWLSCWMLTRLFEKNACSGLRAAENGRGLRHAILKQFSRQLRLGPEKDSLDHLEEFGI